MSAPGAVDAFLKDRVEAGDFPGAVWLVAEEGRVLGEGAVGDAAVEPRRRPASTGTLYDLASLTKPLATALLAVRLHAAGRWDLEDRLEAYLPDWRPEDARVGVTLLDLLTHRSGLPGWDPLYLHAADVRGRVLRIAGMPGARPPLLQTEYSCLNYILLGFAMERSSGAPLDQLFEKQVREPLDGPEILYQPDRALRDRIAPTERGNGHERHLAGASGDGFNAWRRELIWGEVHDNNAHTLGGVAGNAGLFGTARAVYAVASLFLAGGPGLLGDEERALFGHNFTPGLSQARTVGFQRAGNATSSAGAALSDAAFGHTGFTGTSLWIDPVSRRIFVLLTNRVHPSYRDLDMNKVRRDFHVLAAAL
jgi:CubicO group peptidase (beta-lactamase class C family)